MSMKGALLWASHLGHVNYSQGKGTRVKQHGRRDFITALEAVSADGFAFPLYLIGKGSSFIQEDARSNLHETQY